LDGHALVLFSHVELGSQAWKERWVYL
jgi:hypothetical protein